MVVLYLPMVISLVCCLGHGSKHRFLQAGAKQFDSVEAFLHVILCPAQSM